MKPKLLWLGALVLLLSACKKSDEISGSIDGILLHSLTRQPIPNETINIWIVEKKRVGPDPEFPDGGYVPMSRNIQTKTDNGGRFHLSFTTMPQWYYTVALQSDTYILTQIPLGPPINIPDFSVSLSIARQAYDTLTAEKSALITYRIQNTSPGFSNDTLLVKPPFNPWYIHFEQFPYDSATHSTGPGNFLERFNWIFTGPVVDTTIQQRVPAESQPLPELYYYYKRADSIRSKKETPQLAPGLPLHYILQY